MSFASGNFGARFLEAIGCTAEIPIGATMTRKERRPEWMRSPQPLAAL